MNRHPGLDLVERARALQPLIARDADEIERTRRLTPAVTSALIENGLYRSLLPQSFGGAEAPLEIFMQMQEEIAKADASTAWCLGQCSVCAMTAAYLDADAANEIFNVAPGILAWGAIKIGLRGTGTDSYSVDNLFIPDKFAALRDDPTALREKGPLYKLSTNMVFSMGFAATSLGVARATLDAATDLARGKTPQGLKAMKENNAVQGLIGRTEATLRAARAYLYSTAAEVWHDLARGDAITEQHRIALRIAATWTIHQSASVVDTAYHMAGATAVFNANKLERRFRDMHTIAQQIQGRDSHYEDVGKAILSANLGTPPTAR
jgi:alkylation response protein AidB-like acyl-CoA dehydrogenase